MAIIYLDFFYNLRGSCVGHLTGLGTFTYTARGSKVEINLYRCIWLQKVYLIIDHMLNICNWSSIAIQQLTFIITIYGILSEDLVWDMLLINFLLITSLRFPCSLHLHRIYQVQKNNARFIQNICFIHIAYTVTNTQNYPITFKWITTYINKAQTKTFFSNSFQ